MTNTESLPAPIVKPVPRATVCRRCEAPVRRYGTEQGVFPVWLDGSGRRKCRDSLHDHAPTL
jgi:hypothetical protein